MIISDLNYLESVTEEIVIGGYAFYGSKLLNNTILSNLNTNTNLNVNDAFTKRASIAVASEVKGNSSDLTFDNEAIGPNSSTQGNFTQIVSAGEGSAQAGTFTAAANR